MANIKQKDLYKLVQEQELNDLINLGQNYLSET